MRGKGWLAMQDQIGIRSIGGQAIHVWPPMMHDLRRQAILLGPVTRAAWAAACLLRHHLERAVP
jgi:hypothetical protein